MLFLDSKSILKNLELFVKKLDFLGNSLEFFFSLEYLVLIFIFSKCPKEKAWLPILYLEFMFHPREFGFDKVPNDWHTHIVQKCFHYFIAITTTLNFCVMLQDKRMILASFTMESKLFIWLWNLCTLFDLFSSLIPFSIYDLSRLQISFHLNLM